MMVTDKPEDLEARAAELEAQARICDDRALPRSAVTFRERAQRLRQQAADLRKRRTDGVRFG